MATNIPPHNLGEVIDGVVKMIDNPDVTTQELMECIKGPDFPTGGIILGRKGIYDAYSTGRGRIVTRAKTEVEPMPNGRQRIVVTEIPYMVNKSVLVAKIAELVHDKRLEGISDIRDESDREGMRIVIELKARRKFRRRAQLPVQAHADAGSFRRDHAGAGGWRAEGAFAAPDALPLSGTPEGRDRAPHALRPR